MKLNKITYFSIGILMSQLTMANTFTDTFKGPTNLNLNVYVFAADVDGSIGKGPYKYHVDQPFKETIKELDNAYMLLGDLSKGQWGIYADKQVVKTSEEVTELNIPIALSTKLDQSRYGIYYKAYVSPELTQQNYPKFVVEPTIGVHHTEAKAKLSVLNIKADADASWNEFFWGSRFKYNFDSPWNLASELTFGVHDSISAHAYIGYRLPMFKQDFNLRAGYRYLKQDHDANDFNWNIKQRGPVIGINLPIF